MPDNIDGEADAIKDETKEIISDAAAVEVQPLVDVKVEHYSIQYDSKRHVYFAE